MKQLLLSLFRCAMLLWFSIALPWVYASEGLKEPQSPVGYWKTIDDITGKPQSILRIYDANGVLYGQIVRIFPKQGYDQNELCTACKGPKHNQRIVGMVIMEGLKQNVDHPLQWNNGRILDPENGSTYRCQLWLSENGQKLNVRGYIGLPLFGRSQTWIRETAMGLQSNPIQEILLA